ncbi:MarR family winged helix-turn-helix transcriptional regulator [Lactobacillus paragasseri]|uniref:MarR family transcriptional regulator n=1 Tax=Lactobacillus paragasseri TaxID=2107999 RepID=A0ABD5A368_9LACO|nr:MarR family transcriptional regulator [Lactobacillus paragasseri]MDK7953396.1 MarR family transcriptional regulator [Lactobacillus paragasseri]MDO6362269.1 MarR family transcriptional regulator [Lactobacillus paragasseri]MDX5060604.1 MarR family transcriptional regulator [Lactobacillus paragasseri]
MEKEDILRQIGSISRALDSIANIEFKDLKLNRGQYLYLVRIFEHPGIISDQLAILLNIDRTTTSRGVRKIEQAGLVFKKDDEVNKKIKHLFVTEAGEKLAKEIEKENAYSNELMIKGLSKTEQAELGRYLSIIEKNANENWSFVKNGGKREY